jgi:hypothetical protein
MLSEDITIIRSKRRRKTIQTKYCDGRLWIYLPAGMPHDEEDRWVARMVKRHERIKQRDTHATSDRWLTERAQELNQKYFYGSLSFSIRFVDNQHQRFGSCTHADHTIRISTQVKTFPRWVKDYILIHELAHLCHPNHSKKFWDAVYQYPLAERARGYLLAVSDLSSSKKKNDAD